jgi:hypothetical protein
MHALLLLAATYEVRNIAGWTVNIDTRLVQEQRAQTETALGLLEKQLQQIERVVPPKAVIELKKVRLWFSPEYKKGIPPRAEFHPGAEWLKENGRNPDMAQGIEFTNIRIFPDEVSRMPNFALHELAHAYQARLLGFDNKEIRKAYEQAKKSGKYDKVERRNAKGETRIDKAYAMANPMEYFAESTESFFARNDFYPYTRYELQTFDPTMYDLLRRAWQVSRPSTE